MAGQVAVEARGEVDERRDPAPHRQRTARRWDHARRPPAAAWSCPTRCRRSRRASATGGPTARSPRSAQWTSAPPRRAPAVPLAIGLRHAVEDDGVGHSAGAVTAGPSSAGLDPMRPGVASGCRPVRSISSPRPSGVDGRSGVGAGSREPPHHAGAVAGVEHDDECGREREGPRAGAGWPGDPTAPDADDRRVAPRAGERSQAGRRPRVTAAASGTSAP